MRTQCDLTPLEEYALRCNVPNELHVSLDASANATVENLGLCPFPGSSKRKQNRTLRVPDAVVWFYLS